MENMIESHSKVREIEMIYGAAATGLAQGSVASVNSTTTTFTPATGQWSYLWVGCTNRNVDCYSGTTLLNTVGPIVVSKVNVVAKTLTLTGAAADITAINAATAGTVTLFWYLAYGNENLGIQAISANTTGTQFTINASTWELAWVMYQLDRGINFKRNTKGFEYEFKGKQLKFYPDFILENGEYVEIKGWVTEKDKSKFLTFPKTLNILYQKDMAPIINAIISKYGPEYWKCYEPKILGGV